MIKDLSKCIINERNVFVWISNHVAAFLYLSAPEREERQQDFDANVSRHLEHVCQVIQVLARWGEEVPI
jgi:hypothetical protein